MTVDDEILRRRAIQASIAARLQLEIADQHLKQAGVMRNTNTLRRLLTGRDCYVSHLIEALEGVNCELVIKRKDAA